MVTQYFKNYLLAVACRKAVFQNRLSMANDKPDHLKFV